MVYAMDKIEHHLTQNQGLIWFKTLALGKSPFWGQDPHVKNHSSRDLFFFCSVRPSCGFCITIPNNKQIMNQVGTINTSISSKFESFCWSYSHILIQYFMGKHFLHLPFFSVFWRNEPRHRCRFGHGEGGGFDKGLHLWQLSSTWAAGIVGVVAKQLWNTQKAGWTDAFFSEFLWLLTRAKDGETSKQSRQM